MASAFKNENTGGTDKKALHLKSHRAKNGHGCRKMGHLEITSHNRLALGLCPTAKDEVPSTLRFFILNSQV